MCSLISVVKCISKKGFDIINALLIYNVAYTLLIQCIKFVFIAFQHRLTLQDVVINGISSASSLCDKSVNQSLFWKIIICIVYIRGCPRVY